LKESVEDGEVSVYSYYSEEKDGMLGETGKKALS
jgi:hypothetical protein